MIRKLLPTQLKRQIRIVQRSLSDQKTGIKKAFAQIGIQQGVTKKHLVSTIRQPIYYNPLAANKVFNIGLAINEIHRVTVQPNEVFSFWHIVGNPTIAKGYKTGRNIIGDSLKEDIGGGLCQVSGMTYHLALAAGMKIIERYNHTLDLYEEDKRYTPLGADATVVYGYKDLRFKNTTNSAITLRYEVSESEFIGHFYADTESSIYELRFEREEFDTYRTIKTYRKVDNEEEFINLSRYLL